MNSSKNAVVFNNTTTKNALQDEGISVQEFSENYMIVIRYINLFFFRSGAWKLEHSTDHLEDIFVAFSVEYFIIKSRCIRPKYWFGCPTYFCSSFGKLSNDWWFTLLQYFGKRVLYSVFLFRYSNSRGPFACRSTAFEIWSRSYTVSCHCGSNYHLDLRSSFFSFLVIEFLLGFQNDQHCYYVHSNWKFCCSFENLPDCSAPSKANSATAAITATRCEQRKHIARKKICEICCEHISPIYLAFELLYAFCSLPSTDFFQQRICRVKCLYHNNDIGFSQLVAKSVILQLARWRNKDSLKTIL